MILKINDMPELKLEQLDGAYTGKPHTCMCGCAGTYAYTKINQVKSGKNRGYAVTDDEVNDKRVLRVLQNFYNNKENGIEIQAGLSGEFIFTTYIGKTQYTIYTLPDRNWNATHPEIV